MTEAALTARLAALSERFRCRALERLNRLQQLLAELRAEDPTAVSARLEARRLLHELTGGAGTFGLHKLGARAAQLEALLADDPAALPDALRAALPEMRHLASMEAMQGASAAEASELESLAPLTRRRQP